MSACSVLKEVPRAKFDARLLSGSSSCYCLVLNVLLDLLGHRDKRLLNVDRVLSRRLKEGYLKMACELGPLISADLPDLLHVALIADEDLAHPWVSEPLNLMHPLPHVVK